MEEEAGVRALRYRHDGFTPEKRARFLKAFGKCGCVADAAFAAGVSVNTVNRWRRKAAGFAEAMEAARGLAGDALEMIAYRRATVGAREVVIRDGRIVAEKIRPSDAMLRLLLQGTKPGKYGRTGRGGETKAQIEKRVRKEIQAELMATASPGELADAISAKLDALERRTAAKRIAEGWTRTEEGDWIPPGWVKA